MASIFTRTNEYVQPVKRNTFDLSFQNNLTMQFGKLYPAFVQEVLPGDSFKIKPTFALEFMPMVFPVQTRMRANLHFFYVRNRNLWKDFPDFIANTKEVEPPYLDMNGRYKDFLSVGGLGDYLGLPVNQYGIYGTSVYNSDLLPLASCFSDVDDGYPSGSFYVPDVEAMYQYLIERPVNAITPFVGSYTSQSVRTNLSCFFSGTNSGPSAIPFKFSEIKSGFRFDIDYSFGDVVNFSDVELRRILDNFIFVVSFNKKDDTNLENHLIYVQYPRNEYFHIDSEYNDNSKTLHLHATSSSSVLSDLLSKFSDDNDVEILFYLFAPTPEPQGTPPANWTNPNGIVYGEMSSSAPSTFKSKLSISLSISLLTSPVQGLSPENSPYYDSVANPNGLKISALVPRGIETIYNAFYRDIRNNPFMIDGQPEYNKYLETQDGGRDTTPYQLHYRNWEQDFLTTAVQSPQQGQAPLVGISSNGQMKFQSEDGEVFTAQAKFAEDGETLTGFTVESPNMPAGNLRALVDMASSGISINDLRNVNSLQRWLENNMRKGLRLKDQIKAHFNVDIRYDELDMPEFIGGCSETIDVRMVTQTSADVADSPLGSYAGQATCVGTSNHNISHYCDEHGYIIGIFSVAPVPNYSQLLPKHYLKRNVLDYFFPEFGHIGYQPIRYNEVCPVQTFNAKDDLNGTFGYQRAWYDYLARTDEVHGLFRSTLRNYLMNRVFDFKPELTKSFLLVDPTQLNDVFATNIVDEQTGEVKDDKILGQIYFDVKAKRPIPMFGIPRLE